MIFIGLDSHRKTEEIDKYVSGHRIDRIFVLEPKRFAENLWPEAEVIEWADIIRYEFFYRLLQEIDKHTLVVVNECLRVQNRHDLTYNCIRHFLAQAGHQLVFQYLPIIDGPEDFMILFDFDTKSRWKRTKLAKAPLHESEIFIESMAPVLSSIRVIVSEQLRQRYAELKRKLIDNIGLKDPHTIPRNLYLLGGKTKALAADPWAWHIGRGKRYGLERYTTYRASSFSGPYTVLEFPHDFRPFIDFLTILRQVEVSALTADLKVDRWYFDRYCAWAQRIRDVCTAIHR